MNYPLEVLKEAIDREEAHLTLEQSDKYDKETNEAIEYLKELSINRIAALEKAVELLQHNGKAPKIRVRFFPTDTDETFDGTVIEEKPNFYVVVPDQNLNLTQNWNKKRCEVIRGLDVIL